jgi:pilus assembly protein CpaB
MARLRGCLWLVAGLVLAVLAAVVAYMTLSTAEARRAGDERVTPQRQVLVSVGAVELGSALGAEQVALKDYPVDVVPEGAISDPEQAVGRLTLVDLQPGEIILQQRLVDPNLVSADGRRALLVAEDEVLVAFPAGDLLTRMDVLRPGDRVDLLITYAFPTNRPVAGSAPATGGATEEGEEDEQVTFVVLENVGVAGLAGRQTQEVQGGGRQEVGPPQAILFTLSPQDALVLKFVKDTGAIQDIALRAPGAEQPFETEPVDVDYILRRYRIPIGTGE